MKDRYISVNDLLKTLREYHRLSCWNTEVCDADTILRVLEVVENIVKNEPSIGSRQLSNKILKAKDCAIDVYVRMAHDNMTRYQEQERKAETTGNILLMGFYRGMREEAHRNAEILQRLQQPAEETER